VETCQKSSAQDARAPRGGERHHPKQ